MAQEIINIGTLANDGTGDTIRSAFSKTKNNIAELFLSAQSPYNERVGKYYSNNVNSETSTTSAFVANTLRAYPWERKMPFTFDANLLEVTTFGALATVRIGLYTTGSNGYPNALISNTDNGDVDATSNAVKTPTAPASPVLLNPGLYWIAVNVSVACTLRAFRAYQTPPTTGWPSAMGTSGGYVGLSVGQTYGSMPGTFPAGATDTTNLCPIILYRKSA